MHIKKSDGDIIREFRKVLHISQAEFAKVCGVSQALISELEQGRTQKASRKIIEGAIRLSGDDLSKYSDDVLRLITTYPISKASISYEIPLILENKIASFDKDELVFEDEIHEYIDIPKILLHNTFEELNIPKLYAYRINNDIMLPSLKKEDIVVINADGKINNEGLYVLNIQHHFVVRRLKFELDKICLKVDNPKYVEQNLEETWLSANEIPIVGKIIAMMGKF